MIALIPHARAVLRHLAVAAVVFTAVATGREARAEADADVGIDATVTIVFNGRGEFAAVRQRWTFDYDYSAMVRALADANRDGTLDAVELAAALRGPLAWMAAAGYFTTVSEDGQPIAQGAAEAVSFSYELARLSVAFTLPLAAPPQRAIQTVAVTDPSFFYVLRYGTPDVTTEGAPDYCAVLRRSVTGSAIDLEVRCR